MNPTQQQLDARIAATGQQPVAQTAAAPAIPDPFSPAGAQRISQLTGQAVAPTQPTIDPNILASQANQEAAQIYEQTKGKDVDIRESARIIQDLAEGLKSKEAPAAPPSLSELFTTERAKLGLEPLETELSQLDTEIERIEAQAFGEMDKSSERFASRGSIGAEQSKIARDAERQLSLLRIERGALARRVDNKLNALQMTMQFTQQDYANATAQYDREFSRTMQMIDLFEGIEDREIRDKDRKEAKRDKLADNARANLATITNLIKESGKTFTDMTPDQLRNLRQWEIQAGYPEGTFEAFGTAKPGSKILHTATGLDANGNQVVTFIYDDGTGRPGAVEVVKAAGVSAGVRNGDGSGGGGNGSGGGGGSSKGTSFEQWKKTPEAAAVARQHRKDTGGSVGLDKALRDAFNKKGKPATGTKFTPTELKKLEQAGLLNASRQQQLDHLYGKKTSTGDGLDAKIDQAISNYGG